MVAPAAHKSVWPSICRDRPSACSGGMKAGVPIMRPVRVAPSDPLALLKARDSEVEDLEHTVAGEKEVLRLDVAMHDPLRVRGREDVEQLAGQLADFAQGQPAALPLPARVERLALEQLHDEKHRAVIGDVVVEHPHRAAMVHLVGDVTLAQEAACAGPTRSRAAGEAS